ncbi:hypothetical protein R3P38DRAFT_2533741, partial [Favolaschia claudopus]
MIGSGINLTDDQKATLARAKGALLTGRERVLASTATALNQHENIEVLHDSLNILRDETNAQLRLLHSRAVSSSERLVALVNDNGMNGRPPLVTPRLSPLSSPAAMRPLPDPLRADMHSVVPPRAPTETLEEFDRRAQLVGNGKRRAAAALSFGDDALESSTARPQQTQDAYSRMNPTKSLRFEDVSSISHSGHDIPAQRSIRILPEGMNRPTMPNGDISMTPAEEALEEFQVENERKIREFIHRQLGQALDLPARIKPPKLPTPDLYSGDKNDPVEFMNHFEGMATWMNAQFLGGPEADGYRVTLLKSLLTGNARDWFMDYVEGRNGPRMVPYDFTSIVCALHRRFITAATAQKASRVFDLVRYKAEDGPTKLMDDLESASRNMREPMTDFVIRKTFLQRIPSAMREFLTLQRSLSAELSSIKQLRFNASQWWDYHSHNKSNGDGSHSAPQKNSPADRRGPTRNTPTGQDKSGGTGAKPALKETNGGPPQHQKRCFKCGNAGHIASDKICPHHPSHTNPRVGMQRVVDSYAEEDAAERDLDPVDDNWGGSQYESEDEEPAAVNTDLGDLIELDEAEGDVRAGAMQFQYYASRIVISIPAMDSNPSPERRRWLSTLTDLEIVLADLSLNYGVTTAEELYGVSARGDLALIHDQRERDGLPALSDEASGNMLRALVRAHKYPVNHNTSFEELALEYELANEGVPTSRASTEEWDILLRYDAADHLRREVQNNPPPRWYSTSISTNQLAGNIDTLQDIEADMRHVLESINEARRGNNSRLRRARRASIATERLRRPTRERAQEVLDRLGDIYDEVIADTEGIEEDLAPFHRHVNSLHQADVAPAVIPDSPPPDYGRVPSLRTPSPQLPGYAPTAERRLTFVGTRIPGRSVTQLHRDDAEEVEALLADVSASSESAQSDDTLIPAEVDPPADTEEVEEPSDRTVLATSRQPPEPRDNDELILRTLVRSFALESFEWEVTYKDHAGVLYVVTEPLPPNHYLSPQMIVTHSLERARAMRERAEALNCSVDDVRDWLAQEERTIGIRDRVGYKDGEPYLFPGTAFHDLLARQDPEFDDENCLPGFRERTLLAQRIENAARIRRPDTLLTVGIDDQPVRKLKDIACLTAEVEIGGCKAYVLFDSGSNTDSITPEFAKATRCKVFKLEEQITLQLGCVGSRARINYGARAPVAFGGIAGYAYFDVVNLDRYDVVIGTPFMIKHKLLLDFGEREIRFPNGKTIPALSLSNEMSLIKERTDRALRNEPGRSLYRYPPVTIEDVDDEEDNCLPYLPSNHPHILLPESDFLTLPPAIPARRHSVAVEEIPDDSPTHALPPLPWDYPYVLELPE